MTCALVYKLFRESEWHEAECSGVFSGSPDDRRDGFIHLSALAQVRGTYAKYFAAESASVLVCFQANDLAPALKWEISRNGELFPHLYGTLPIGLAVAIFNIRRDASGAAIFPPEIP